MAMTDKTVLITGGVGFIGSHLRKYLSNNGYSVAVIDNLKPSYPGDIHLKRLPLLRDLEIFNIDLRDKEQLTSVIKNRRFQSVIHLAGWPGVQLSHVKPFEYVDNNINSFNNVLDILRDVGCENFLYASSSSVKGNFSNLDNVFGGSANDGQIRSLYAVTKLCMEEIAQTDSRLQNIRHCGLRFFSVVGEFGRPDMAYWIFAKQLIAGQTINLRGREGGFRDYTSVHDLKEVIREIIELPRENQYPKILDIGSGETFPTSHIIKIYEDFLGTKAHLNEVPSYEWEMSETQANTQELTNSIGLKKWRSKESIFREFILWYKSGAY
jgi:UDP-glucuronate 4-epimerase